VFALNVLSNCDQRCIFCGLNPSAFGAGRMLVAGHIKPWKDSAPSERLDPRNGLAAFAPDGLRRHAHPGPEAGMAL
jgi:putative restriction endonuclease